MIAEQFGMQGRLRRRTYLILKSGVFVDNEQNVVKVGGVRNDLEAFQLNHGHLGQRLTQTPATESGKRGKGWGSERGSMGCTTARRSSRRCSSRSKASGKRLSRYKARRHTRCQRRQLQNRRAHQTITFIHRADFVLPVRQPRLTGLKRRRVWVRHKARWWRASQS